MRRRKVRSIYDMRPDVAYYLVRQRIRELPRSVAMDGPVIASAVLRKHVEAYRDGREHMLAAFVDGSQRVLAVMHIGEGTSNACLIDMHAAIRAAILLGASGIVHAHNHPSGSPKPSDEDAHLHLKFQQIADVCGVKVLDGLIFSREGYYTIAGERFCSHNDVTIWRQR